MRALAHLLGRKLSRRAAPLNQTITQSLVVLSQENLGAVCYNSWLMLTNTEISKLMCIRGNPREPGLYSSPILGINYLVTFENSQHPPNDFS